MASRCHAAVPPSLFPLPGEAQSGHYYSYIRPRPRDDDQCQVLSKDKFIHGVDPDTSQVLHSAIGGQWLLFNDDSVTEVSEARVMADTFGTFATLLFAPCPTQYSPSPSLHRREVFAAHENPEHSQRLHAVL